MKKNIYAEFNELLITVSSDYQIDKAFIIVSFAMFVLSLPFYIYVQFNNIRSVFNYGYGIIYEIKHNGTISYLSSLFPPTCLMLLYCFRNNKSRYIFLLLILMVGISDLYLGTRSKPMAIIMCVLYFWDSSIRKITKKDFLLVGAIILACIFMIPFIKDIRSGIGRTIQIMNINNYFLNIGDSIVSVFSEMGSTMQIWLRLQYIIPKQVNYNYGFSYVASLLSCVPSFLMGGFSFAKYANLSKWITEFEKADYGLGFSVLGELFYNFGWLGIFASLFVMDFIFYFLSSKWCKGSIEKYKNLFSILALYFFATGARDSMYLSIRNIVYCMFIPIIITISIRKYVK